MRRRGRRAVDGRDVLRDRGARAPMERASGVLVVQPPNGIAHIHLTMIARGINDVLVTMTFRADIDADTDRARAPLIRRLAQKPCQRV
jgi:protocatechuate 3,4-dioxygenase beta subunit